MSARDLSPRQATIVGMVCRGSSNHEVAAALGIHLSTVKNHLRDVHDLLGVHDRGELCCWFGLRLASRLERTEAGSVVVPANCPQPSGDDRA